MEFTLKELAEKLQLFKKIKEEWGDDWGTQNDGIKFFGKFM